MAKNLNLEYKVIVYDPRQTVLENFGQNNDANGANVSKQIVCRYRQKTLDDYSNKTLYDFGQESE
jgi:hypothetical protein